MAGRAVFLSYSHEDAQSASALEADLTAAGVDVWRDQRLSGGQEWWNTILQQIRAADVFAVVVSEESVRSLPCGRELDYALRLGKPVLPVGIASPLAPSLLPAELASRQILDYADDKASALRLVRALADLPPASPLPDPLPEPPDVPLSYTSELASVVHRPRELTVSEQYAVLGELRAGLDDPDGVDDCRALLVVLRDRREVVAGVAAEIDGILHGRPRPSGGVRSRLPRHPVLAPTLCAVWLLWVATHLLGGSAGDYLGLGFVLAAGAAALAAGLELTWLPGHAPWLLAIAVNSVAVIPLLVTPMDSEQAATTRIVLSVIAAALLVLGLRARRLARGHPTAHDEGSLVGFLVSAVGCYGFLVAESAAESAGDYGLGGTFRNITAYCLLAAAGICAWLAVLSRLVPASTPAEPGSAARSR